MENEEAMETEARMLQQAADDPQSIDVQASQVISAFAGEPVNEGSALLGATQGRRDSQSENPTPPNAWYDPQFEGLPWYRRPGVSISFFALGVTESVSTSSWYYSAVSDRLSL